MKKNTGWRSILVASLFVISAMNMASAQTFTSLASFDGADGQLPVTTLIQGQDGDFYGTTMIGGANQDGSIFKVTAQGEITTLYSFCSRAGCADGGRPRGALVQALDGTFYGTTIGGGRVGMGTLFKITPAGGFGMVYSFCSLANCTDGAKPLDGLTLAADGSLYGTTSRGGAYNGGTIFKITPAGVRSTLYSFCAIANCADGSWPYAGLVQGMNGNLYGTTNSGGSNYAGTVFEINPKGKFKTLYSFCAVGDCLDGAYPQSVLMQSIDNTLYGTTPTGGANGVGTVFYITQNGRFSTLYNFCSIAFCPDGAQPQAGLIQGSDGNLYGTTAGVLPGQGGTVFQITQAGSLHSVYGFCSLALCADGAAPLGALVQGTDGSFYGTTGYGGASNCRQGCGTVFNVNGGFDPFVAMRPAGGEVGAQISILGQGFSSASVVSFNGAQATMVSVNGSSDLIATVPAGARTGFVTVVTGASILTSTREFIVLSK